MLTIFAFRLMNILAMGLLTVMMFMETNSVLRVNSEKSRVALCFCSASYFVFKAFKIGQSLYGLKILSQQFLYLYDCGQRPDNLTSAAADFKNCGLV